MITPDLILNLVTLWNKVLLEKIIVPQLAKKFHKGALPCSQEPAIGPYPDPSEFVPLALMLFI
jgi:hypothetical protein